MEFRFICLGKELVLTVNMFKVISGYDEHYVAHEVFLYAPSQNDDVPSYSDRKEIWFMPRYNTSRRLKRLVFRMVQAWYESVIRRKSNDEISAQVEYDLRKFCCGEWAEILKAVEK